MMSGAIGNRARLLAGTVNNMKSKGVAYYMHRDQRVQDNWALLYAQELALQMNVPLHVVAGINVKHPISAEATRRTLDFTLGGLEEVSQDCMDMNISFHFLEDHEVPMFKRILTFMEVSEVNCVISDFSPLKPHMSQMLLLGEELKKRDGCCLYQVDTHNIVPCWLASNKSEPRATEFRNSVMKRFDEFFTDFPKLLKHPVSPPFLASPIDWSSIRKSVTVDESVEPVEWARPGTESAFQLLDKFIENALHVHAESRNNPTVDAISNLSPWLHTGQISAQRVCWEVKKQEKQYPADVKKFVDEAVTWSEMSDNYCFYNSNYDNLEGAPGWAIETLKKHEGDKREYLYTREQFDNAQTHDNLWNAAQIQLKREGKMHGFMRMYWAKKIQEWTISPEQAIEFALYFNDHYSLDGADSNGYAGVMWSIAGVHDPPELGERPVIGKIRYMSHFGCERKFDIQQYMSRYNHDNEGKP